MCGQRIGSYKQVLNLLFVEGEQYVFVIGIEQTHGP